MRVIQFREAIAEAMSEEMRKDEKIFLMGEEVASAEELTEMRERMKAACALVSSIQTRGSTCRSSNNLKR